ncbi:MAG: acyl-ACP--UDP-N-acetylglucosamine O-acyltransferase [Phycisphaeraceae bacterium]|nr:MAG: acyl-ACP--UDP-N-acetylglucosamine O-acyltransferase [Phycisphaeraceae bacterium]
MPTAAGVTVHPTAIVSDQASLAPGVVVGPRCTIDGPAVLGENTHLIGDVHLHGDTHLGPGCTIYPYACIGFGPQHVKIRPGDPIGGVRIGAGAVIREHATVHASMYPDKLTIIGDRFYLMVTGHVGHDCIIGDDVIICNGAMVAGHCEIDDRVYISGKIAVHQFCRIGKGAMLSGGAGCNADVPPYCTLVDVNMLAGLNLVGMRRAGIDREEITIARRAFREVFRTRLDRASQIRRLDELGAKSAPVREMADFVRDSKRGVVSGDGRPRPHTLGWLRRVLRPDAWVDASELLEAGEPDGVA